MNLGNFKITLTVDDRERRSIEMRMKEAHLPRIKTLDEFDFAQSPHIPASRLRALAEGGYLERAEPVLLVGDPGTGKSHLATGLAIGACRQRRRVRFTTAAALVNQLVEAQREHNLSRMLARWSRVELIVIDELGYVPLAEVAAELLFLVHRRTGGKGRPHRHHQPALLRVAPGFYQRPALQGRARPPDRPGAHHRDRVGVVPLPQNPEEETERISLGVFGSRSPPFFLHNLAQVLPPDSTASWRFRIQAPKKFCLVARFRRAFRINK